MASLSLFLSLCGCLVLVFLCNSSSATRIVQPKAESGVISVVEGGSVTLVCVSNTMMKWKAGGVWVETNDDIDIDEENSTLAGEETIQSTLTIRNLKPVNSATYQCIDVDDILAQDASEVEVKLILAEKLKITAVDTNITGSPRLDVGNELMLQCVGKYRSKPTWKLEGVALVEVPGVVTISEEENSDNDSRRSLLTLSNVTKSDAGNYRCIDSAHYQTDSDSFTVHVGSHAFKTVASSLVLALCLTLVTASSHLFN